MNTGKGKFIVVEGLEGAGKSTVLNYIKKYLTDKVPEFICTREPGGTHIGEVVRELIKETHQEKVDPKTELLLFYAARVQLIEQVVKPALNRGHWVLADRFELSTFAYQGGGRQIHETMIQQLSLVCLQEFKPDLIIFLDISPEKGLQRVKGRGQCDRIEQESYSFFRRVYEAYHDYIKKMDNVVIINAEQRLTKVHQEVRTLLEKYLDHVPAS